MNRKNRFRVFCIQTLPDAWKTLLDSNFPTGVGGEKNNANAIQAVNFFQTSFKHQLVEPKFMGGHAFRKFFIIVFNCSRREAIIVNVCVFFMQSFRLTFLTFRVTFTPLTFCVSRDLKFSLNHNFKQLDSIGGNLILKVKWKVRWNWCHFLL